MLRCRLVWLVVSGFEFIDVMRSCFILLVLFVWFCLLDCGATC